MSGGFRRGVRELLRGDDRARAREIENAKVEQAARESVPSDLRRELADHARAAHDVVRVGRLVEAPDDLDLTVLVRSLLTHILIIGASGSGKTFLMIKLLLETMQRSAASFFVLDMKGELSELLLTRLLPWVASQLPPSKQDAFVKRVVVIDPFSSTHLPPLNVLARDPAMPVALQARDVAECFQAAVEAEVGPRMDTILDWFLRLMILAGGSFRTLRRALDDDRVLYALVASVTDADVKRYFEHRYAREPAASKLALLARLDRFLAIPAAELCLGAASSPDFDALLRGRIVVVNLGRFPGGMQSLARFFATLIFTRFVRALYRLPPAGAARPTIFVGDEWHVALTRDIAAEFESILTQCRSRGVAVWLANQQLTQLDGHGASLRSIALGQTAVQFAFRMSPDDATVLRTRMPATGRVPRAARDPWAEGRESSPFLSPDEEAKYRVATAVRLPNRVAIWNDRRQSWGSHVFRSATLSLPEPSSLPADLVARIERGAIALPIAALERMKRDEDDAVDALVHAATAGAILPASGPLLAASSVRGIARPPAPRGRGRGHGGHSPAGAP